MIALFLITIFYVIPLIMTNNYFRKIPGYRRDMHTVLMTILPGINLLFAGYYVASRLEDAE